MCEHLIKFEDTMCENSIKFKDTRFELGIFDAKRLSMMLAPTQQPIECLTRTCSLCIVYVLDSVIILHGVCVSHGCCFVCMWLDHYLHQHGMCGPMDAMWLGGIATFTTARDWCTKIVLYPNATIFGCVHLVLQVLEYVFLWLMISLKFLYIMFR